MSEQPTRREFLRVAAAAAATLALRPVAFPAVPLGERFDVLVLGDSLVWGQGLEEHEKFYTIVADWIRTELFAGRREVAVNVKAHSGATIELPENEAAAFKSAAIDASVGTHPEINVSYPAIRSQLDASVRETASPETVGLILLSGGIPEVGVANILNPFRSDESLRREIELHCFETMSRLLGDIASSFPNALVVITGYYPIITPHTPVQRIVNDILEVYNWPGWAKPLVNNPLNRVLWRRYRRRMIRRSRIWHENSTEALARAADLVNRTGGGGRILFVPSPLLAENGYGAKKTLLWNVEKGRAPDILGDVRKQKCGPALDELRRKTELTYRKRLCELASIGHPNADGATIYAAAIKQRLAPFIKQRVSNR